MPLETQILRDGKPLVVPWDYFTLSCMYTSAIREGDPSAEYDEGKTYGAIPDSVYDEGPSYDGWIDFSMCYIYGLDYKCDLIQKGRQTLLHGYRYWSGERELELHAGDVLTAYRSSKR